MSARKAPRRYEKMADMVLARSLVIPLIKGWKYSVLQAPQLSLDTDIEKFLDEI